MFGSLMCLFLPDVTAGFSIVILGPVRNTTKKGPRKTTSRMKMMTLWHEHLRRTDFPMMDSPKDRADGQ